MSVPLDAAGRSESWVEENPGNPGRRILTAVARTLGQDATELAKSLLGGDSLDEIVGKKGVPRELVREVMDQELRRPGGPAETARA